MNGHSHHCSIHSSDVGRAALARRGKQLEYLSLAWNGIEGGASLIAALMAGSTSLLAFGVDSLIEVSSALALIMAVSAGCDSREAAQSGARQLAHRWLLRRPRHLRSVRREQVAPISGRDGKESSLGIAVAGASIVVMRWLKQSVGLRLVFAVTL